MDETLLGEVVERSMIVEIACCCFFITGIIVVKPALFCRSVWTSDVFDLISLFDNPELFSFLTSVCLALWLVSFFSGHRSANGEFSFIFFVIPLIGWVSNFVDKISYNFYCNQATKLANSVLVIRPRIKEKSPSWLTIRIEKFGPLCYNTINLFLFNKRDDYAQTF